MPSMIEDKLLAKKAPRTIHVYDVPRELSDTDDITSIGLVELTAEEELMAAKRTRDDSMKLGFELIKQSLAEVNGSPVSLADGSADKAWTSMGAKLRHVLLQAWHEIHKAKEDVEQSFLKSRRMKA